MPDRPEQILRKVCQVLVAVLILRVAWVVLRPNPLSNLVIPDLPQLAGASPTASATNRPTGAAATNASAGKPGTHSPASATNGVTAGVSTNGSKTNSIALSSSNAPSSKASNSSPGPVPPGMPPGMPPMMAGPMMMGGMPGMPGGRPGAPAAPLDPLVSARIDKIIQSELLGPIPHPLPMALLGIAGHDAFIRTPSGMSGMIHEGAEFGGIKLLRIGTNRVLVEEAGAKKELMIFEGAGGVSLLTP